MGLKLSPFSIAILLSYEIKLFTGKPPLIFGDPGGPTLEALEPPATGKSLQTPL